MSDDAMSDDAMSDDAMSDDAMSGDVLLIRLNSSIEVFNTSPLVDAVRARFPGARLLTLATPQTERMEFLRADPRLDGILLFPPDTDDPRAKTPAALRRFLGGRDIAASVACYGSTPGFDYSRHLLSLLLSPGRKYLLDARGTFLPAHGARGLATLARAAAGLAARPLARRAMQALARRRPPAWDPARVRRVLVIRLDRIGDVAMSLPAVRALKENFPAARIDMLLLPGAEALVADQPEVGEVFSSARPLALAARLRRRGYDLAVDLRGDDLARRAAFRLGAPVRIGPLCGPYEAPDVPNYSFLLTHPVPLRREARHAVAHTLDLLRGAGLAVAPGPYRLAVTAGRTAAVAAKRQALGLLRPFVVFHARPSHPTKEWRPERFAAVADQVVRRHGLDVLLTGSADDWDYNEVVRGRAEAEDRVHNVSGAFALEELPALFASARLMVTVDTGPMHIAAATGTAIVSLLLPWNFETFHPAGQADGAVLPSSAGVEAAARSGSLRQGKYLDGILAADVLAAIARKLGPPA